MSYALTFILHFFTESAKTGWIDGRVSKRIVDIYSFYGDDDSEKKNDDEELYGLLILCLRWSDDWWIKDWEHSSGNK